MEIHNTTEENTNLNNNSIKLAEDLKNSSMPIGEVISVDSKGQSFKLILNETFSLLNVNDNLEFKLPINNWGIHLSFISDPRKQALLVEYEIFNNIIYFKLNNWNGNDIENQAPVIISSTDHKKTIYIKIRSSSNLYQNFRHLTVTIWQKN